MRVLGRFSQQAPLEIDGEILRFAALLDPDVGDDELRARLLSIVPEEKLHEDQSDLASWTRGDRKARFEQTAERHAGLTQFAAPYLSRMKFVDEQGRGSVADAGGATGFWRRSGGRAALPRTPGGGAPPGSPCPPASRRLQVWAVIRQGSGHSTIREPASCAWGKHSPAGFAPASGRRPWLPAHFAALACGFRRACYAAGYGLRYVRGREDADADADADASEPFAVSRLARRRVMDGVAIAAVGVAITVTHGAVTGEVIPRRF